MHDVTVVQALLVALWAGIAAIDQFNGLTHIHRPIVTGAVIGLILGDPTKGLITGGALELVWAGMVPLAGAQPPNVVIGGVIGTLFAILSGLKPTVAVGVAVPFAVIGQGLITLLFTVMSPLMQRFDKAALKADTKAIDRMTWIEPAILFFGFGAIAFAAAMVGRGALNSLVAVIPQWVLTGLQAAGGIMPAVGFGMLLKIMFKIEYAPYFIVGFLAAAYGNLPILGIALMGVAIAGYDFFSHRNDPSDSSTGTPAAASDASPDSDDKEDYSNGI